MPRTASGATERPAQLAVDPRAAADVRVAIVGAGRIAVHHARAILRLGVPARVVAVADPVTTTRDTVLAVCPGARAYSSLDEVLAGEAVDVVHVCTPPDTHERLAVQALQNGCHAYVEKPFAQSAAAAERIVELAASKKLRVCAGHQLLFEPPALRALSLLRPLGTVVHVESFFAFRPIRRRPDGRPALPADAQLLDILPHPVYLLLRFLAQAAPTERAEAVAVETGPGGTVHALVRCGSTTGAVTVTLEGRPVETCVHIVGTNGSVHADFVRGTVQHLIGPGSSAIDKALNPFRVAQQLVWGSTAALANRVLKRQVSYPGLGELVEAFYASLRTDSPPPLSPNSIVETVRICEQIASGIEQRTAPPAIPGVGAGSERRPQVVVTGGTGLLGSALVRTLVAQGTAVRALARRLPAHWERVPRAEYRVGDLADALAPEALHHADVAVHCAAETAGSWDEHQRNSIDSTEHLLRAAAQAGIRRVVHVSSIAVLAPGRRGSLIAEDSPLESGRGSGPYVWGKAASERLAVERGPQLGVEVKVVRLAAIVDYQALDPPGRLGRRVGNWFVAIGSSREQLGVVDLDFAAKTLAWVAGHFDSAPTTLNVLSPALPTKAELVAHLRARNPGLRVIWLPRAALYPLSWVAVLLQKLLRPGKPATRVASVFARRHYGTSRIAGLEPVILGTGAASEATGRLE